MIQVECKFVFEDSRQVLGYFVGVGDFEVGIFSFACMGVYIYVYLRMCMYNYTYMFIFICSYIYIFCVLFTFGQIWGFQGRFVEYFICVIWRGGQIFLYIFYVIEIGI